DAPTRPLAAILGIVLGLAVLALARAVSERRAQRDADGDADGHIVQGDADGHADGDSDRQSFSLHGRAPSIRGRRQTTHRTKQNQRLNRRMTHARTVRVAIIGSGPAGWTAAIYAARASLNPVVIAGIQPGGQLTITTDVENYPGFAETIQGPWLMQQMQEQAEHVGTEVIHAIVTKADLSQRPFLLTLDSGTEILAETIIISTGAQAKWLGLESEAAYQGF